MGKLDVFITRVGEHFVTLGSSPLILAILGAVLLSISRQTRLGGRSPQEAAGRVLSVLVMSWIALEIAFGRHPIAMGSLPANTAYSVGFCLFISAWIVGREPIFAARRVASLCAFLVFYFAGSYGLLRVLDAAGYDEPNAGVWAATFVMMLWLSLSIVLEQRARFLHGVSPRTASNQGA